MYELSYTAAVIIIQHNVLADTPSVCVRATATIVWQAWSAGMWSTRRAGAAADDLCGGHGRAEIAVAALPAVSRGDFAHQTSLAAAATTGHWTELGELPPGPRHVEGCKHHFKSGASAHAVTLDVVSPQVFRAMPALLAECHEPDSEAARALAALLEAAPAEVRSTANFATALQHMAALITVSIPDWLQALAPSLTALVPGLPPPSPVLSAAANDAAALDRTLTELARRPGPWQQPVPDDGCTTASEHAHEQPRETEEPRGTEVPPRVVDAVKHHSGIAIERVLIPCGEPTQSLWTVGGDGLLRCHRIEWVEPANPFDTTVPSPLFTAAQTTVCTPLVRANGIHFLKGHFGLQKLTGDDCAPYRLVPIWMVLASPSLACQVPTGSSPEASGTVPCWPLCQASQGC